MRKRRGTRSVRARPLRLVERLRSGSLTLLGVAAADADRAPELRRLVLRSRRTGASYAVDVTILALRRAEAEFRALHPSGVGESSV